MRENSWAYKENCLSWAQNHIKATLGVTPMHELHINHLTFDGAEIEVTQLHNVQVMVCHI